jgi:hypothetical protein
VQDLQRMETPFTREDIGKIISSMLAEKTPGLDSFNGLFLKKCWHTIKDDVYNLYQDFFNGVVDIQSVKNSFITLVPKVNTPITLNDFRLISLLNGVVKIITKLMGDRL